MPRPLRLEYEDAYYHVMNRGRGRQKIFHSKEYYNAFYAALDEANQRFGLQILCYCLMPNHYHLLVKTPEANLSRAMRHINGVYTQRYNRLKKADGPLFRGRYKAIVVEEDSYQLQLSRYIHRNPLEAKLVKSLDEYPWSSYEYFVNKKSHPAWLYPQEVWSQFHSKRNKHAKYQAFVEQGVDEEIRTLYGKGNMMPYLGSDEFRSWAYSEKVSQAEEITEQEKFQFKPDMDSIIEKVAEIFDVSVQSILTSQRGITNLPRWAAMHLCQTKGDHRLIDIAKKFGLKRTGSIPTTISKLKKEMALDKKLKKKVNSAI
jgi:putative transposase